MTQRKLKGLFVLHQAAYDRIYGPNELSEIYRHVDIYAPLQTPAMIKTNPMVLNDADIIFSGWGLPVLDEEFLNNAPNLKVIFYGSGTIKYFITEQAWERGIKITSAFAANAIPVAEFTLGQILLSLKAYWYHARQARSQKTFISSECVGPGVYGSTVGLISLGTISRCLCQRLLPFNIKIVGYDPYVTQETAQMLNVELCSLEDVFRNADVISLHAPLNEQTKGMITSQHFHLMKPYATFINTARGAIVDEEGLIDAFTHRSDLTALLDVTAPEPPKENSPLYTLKNIILSAHIAGSIGAECRRMGDYMVQELRRYMNGLPLEWEVTQEMAEIMA
ncbi:MAG: glycerate dehydrogenase [Planctomycetes bacterium GWF2_42_9]|nr:MAG: glycerate dehydrogenase [Planctomycetes bacterium GWF2_42_9]